MFSLLAPQFVEVLQKRCANSRKRGSTSCSGSPARCGQGKSKSLLHLYFSTMLKNSCVKGLGGFFLVFHYHFLFLCPPSIKCKLAQAAQDGAAQLGEAAHV